MKVSDLVRFKDDWRQHRWWHVGLVIKIWKDSALMSGAERQVKILWGDSSFAQHSINLLEVVSEGR